MVVVVVVVEGGHQYGHSVDSLPVAVVGMGVVQPAVMRRGGEGRKRRRRRRLAEVYSGFKTFAFRSR